MAEEIVGYRRVVDGDCCDFCAAVDGAFVYSDDPMPLHPGCGCSVEPVTAEERSSELERRRGRRGGRRAEPARPQTPPGALEGENAVRSVLNVRAPVIEELDPEDAATGRFFPDRD